MLARSDSQRLSSVAMRRCCLPHSPPDFYARMAANCRACVNSRKQAHLSANDGALARLGGKAAQPWRSKTKRSRVEYLTVKRRRSSS